jgi:type II secretory pathway pseudopilin PulG
LDDGGFTMVVLLIVMAVMAVGMTTLLPTWRQQAIREKEEELIFRGNQYARALVLYSRKNNNLLPANIDVLYDGKFLRRKWKDPITGEDFGLLPAGQPANAGRGQPVGPGGQPARGGGAPQIPQTPQPPRGTGPGSSAGQQIVGSIQGVYSTSEDTSIRVYQNQQRYIDWQFTVQTAMAQMGAAPGGGAAGQPGRGGGNGRQGGVNAPPGIGQPGRGGGLPGRGGADGGRGRGGQPPQPGRGGTGGRGRGGG